MILAACGGGPSAEPEEDEEATPAEQAPTEVSEEPAATEEAPTAEPEAQLAEELSVYNWPNYIDEELLT